MQDVIANADFADGEAFTLDGLRVDFADGFLLLRPSNTTPYLIARFEAGTEARLKQLQQQLKDLLAEVAPDLSCPF